MHKYIPNKGNQRLTNLIVLSIANNVIRIKRMNYTTTYFILFFITFFFVLFAMTPTRNRISHFEKLIEMFSPVDSGSAK